jgi:hypothetical protein
MSPTRRQYEVDGMPKRQVPVPSNAPLLKEYTPPSSLQLKTPTEGAMVRQHETPTSSSQMTATAKEPERETDVEKQAVEVVTFSYHDDLSDIIKEAQNLQHIVRKLRTQSKVKVLI